ncbi:hypothetical protein FO440_11140 [Mucilaginibacter corticis]|uniref:Lipoprotein n=1 Tax=Mucilaginibacter corticis TaxID=2597670 RepID=A0A556MK81_9SPHI|nr:hypothetical protein [Mucilaginibacter corticis]TSJ40307.1 hypothetical protein FO440_11140 [Mucilaginibacter corticis]
MNKKILYAILFVFLFSCKTHVNSDTVVYNNDFESANTTNIENAILGQYNGSAVLGQYNSSSNAGNFKLTVNNLPKHDIITISFDLYIHDSWDGNKLAPYGPDIWQMLVDGKVYINTTFSNDICADGNFCSPQSYPFNYPNNYNNPKKGAYKTNLSGLCSVTGPNTTTQYKITKTFTHTSSTLVLQCLDKLVQMAQSNTSDPGCDGSWSVDNINIKATTL